MEYPLTVPKATLLELLPVLLERGLPLDAMGLVALAQFDSGIIEALW
jgi:hypothetical protein